MISSVRHSRKGNAVETVKKSGVPVPLGTGQGGMNSWNTEYFQGTETILVDTVVVGACRYIFVQTQYNTKSER